MGTLLLAGGPLPPLGEDEKEDVGEVEGATVSMPDYSVLDRDNLFIMEGNPWVDAGDLEANPWAVPEELMVMVVDVLVTEGKGKEKEKSPSSDISGWYF